MIYPDTIAPEIALPLAGALWVVLLILKRLDRRAK